MGGIGAVEARACDGAGLEADRRLERMDRVAVLFAEITAATREFLVALAACDALEDWAEEGFGSCAEWLAWRVGITRNAANEKVRVARALESLPLVSESMARGEISYSKVKALTRVATPDCEAELLALAQLHSAATLERLVRGWKVLDRADEDRAERLRHRSRRFSIFPDGDGMYVVRGLVTPEVAAVLMRAVEAAGDALFGAASADRERTAGTEQTADSERTAGSEQTADRERTADTEQTADRERTADSERTAGERPREDEQPEPEQRRADALGLIAERALAAGFGGEDAPVSGSRAERYQVVLHVERASLTESSEPGMCELEDGTRVSAETARRLSCDASVVEAAKAPDGSVLDVGRKSRTFPPALRRALEIRDRGCRFPGCGLRFTDGHHIVHWADGGETSLKNSLLLCRRHHRYVHEGGWSIFSDVEGHAVFFTPRGRVVAAAPPMPTTDADALLRRNRERGVAPDWRTGLPSADAA